MARILFISYYSPPEKAAAAVCVSETAKRLVKLGHCVTVLTTVPNYPTGSVPVQYRGHLLQQEVMDGVRVVRVWSYVSANIGFLRRVLAHLSFACLAPTLVWRTVGHPDVIIVGSPPLFTSIAARTLSWLQQQNRDDIRFVLVGNGAEKAALITQAQRRALKNVLFLDPVPHDHVPQLLAAADSCLAHTRKVQLFEGMLPMKMYEAMAAGRPLILALNGEACRIAVQEAEAALHVEPENAPALA